MGYLLSSLIKLSRDELRNIVLDYQHKSDNSLNSILELYMQNDWN